MKKKITSCLLIFGSLACGLVTAAGVQPRSASLFAAKVVRSALKVNGTEPEMSVHHREALELRRIVSRSLDTRLLNGIRNISGIDVNYRWHGSDITASLGTIVLLYSDAATSGKMAALLEKRGNYFRHSKILVRFSAVPLGSHLALIYSETSGDPRIVKVLGELPAEFARSSASGATQWGE